MARVEKPYFTFARGINTEASLINFPDGFSTDEENYDIFIDGSRRRRKGLGLETGGAAIELDNTISQGDVVSSRKWPRPNNNPDINFVALQVGSDIYFFNDENPISLNKRVFTIDLTLRKVAGATDAQVASSPVDMSEGRGHLFIVGKYIEPFWVEYDEDDSVISLNEIVIKERDFEGIDDGISNTTQPVTPTNSHTYNLQNRGWKTEDLTAFRSSESKDPAKNMVSWLGYRRATTSGVAEEDWTKEFSPDKLVAELFQDASAPQGHFLRDPFNPSEVEVPSAGANVAITNWTISGTTAGTQTITITTDGAHGLSPTDETTISGQLAVYISSPPFFGIDEFSFNGPQTVVSTPSGSTFTITITDFPSNFVSWVNQYGAYGTVATEAAENTGAEDSPYRPRSAAFFAGRVWYAGTPFRKLSSKLFFSQVIESEAQYGKCYQVADPTDERISDIVSTDGGVIHIPEASDILKIIPYGSVLLVFASNGVWQVGGGQSGYFTAVSYSLKRITDVGATSPHSIVIGDNVPYYTGGDDVYALVQDQNSGFLVAQNLSEFTIHSLYNKIPDVRKRNMQGVYDGLNKRVMWLYNSSSSATNYVYNSCLVYNTRLQAFYKYNVSSSESAYLAAAFTLRKAETAQSNIKIKFAGITSTGTYLTISETNQTDYQDFGISEPDAFIVTGYEVLQDPSKFRYAPYVYVFSKKTESGYTLSNGDYLPVGESSTKLQARWNWADLSVSGKWGREQEAYRHSRQYLPASESDGFDDGSPVIVTKNKIRGRGRSLHLKFRAGPGKDSWVLGWKTNYDVQLDGAGQNG